ncbi:MAG TPA: DUF4105 domain-containing protein [Polyangiaceae bacterium]|nr:DUF4105 domain-containing protein [Polyangiaceae bacterium]
MNGAGARSPASQRPTFWRWAVPGSIALLLVATLCGPASAQPGAPAPPPAVQPQPAAPVPPQPARLAPRISVVTFGPGDETFSKFGHDAILISDPRQAPANRELVFNYGTFRFDSPSLILDFLKGKLSYWLSVSTLERTLEVYRAFNRSVSVQELSIPPETALAIQAFLYENAKPENSHYRYDYYLDNCSTRIRDVLDRHLGGRLAEASRGPAPLTYREHTRRLTVGAPFLFFGLDLAMGPLIDHPVSEWQAMFLPEKVEAKLAQMTDEHGAPLVKRQRVLFDSKRPPLSQTAPGFRWGWLMAGVLVGAALYGLGLGQQRLLALAHALALAAVGTLTGVLGSLLLVLWLLTDHAVTYWNQNVLLCPIWALAIPVLCLDFARSRPKYSRAMLRLVGAALASSVLALLLLGLGTQATGPAVSLFLPLWLGAGLGVWVRCGKPALLSVVRAERALLSSR